MPADDHHLQTMLFLQLAAGGHMLLFVVRARAARCSFRPGRRAPLFFAIVAIQIVAVLMCAYGVLVPALPWALIGVVWAYVIVWTILTDTVKVIFNAVTTDRKQETPLTAHAMPIR